MADILGMEELDIESGIADIPAQTPEREENPALLFEPFGTAIRADEIRDRLSASLYRQLSESSDDTTLRAVSRAQIYAGAIFRFLSVPFNLNDRIVREIVLLYTVYELHIALGHEEAGREYRMLAKNLIIASYGKFPDSEDTSAATVQTGVAVAKPKRPGRFCNYAEALRHM